MPAESDRRSIPVYIPMILAALAIRLAVIPFVYGEWMQPYFVEHWDQGNVARALLAGRGFGSPFPVDMPSTIMPPVYCCIVAAIFWMFGIHTVASIIAALSLNCLFSALACIPVYLIAQRSFGDRTAKWATWGWAFSPYGIYFAAEWAWSTHLLLLLLYWLLYLAQDMERSDRPKLWLGFGLLSGFAALTEPVALSVVPFLIALSAWRLRERGKAWLMPAGVAVLALLATLSPWFIRNYVTFHRFIPMRGSMGLQLYLGNHGESLHWVHVEHHPNHDPAELEAYRQMGEMAYMDHKLQQAVSYISAHPGWYAWMSFRRAVYLWTGYWSFDRAYLAEEPLDPPNVFLATAMSLLAMFGLIKAFRSARAEAIRYAGVLFFLPFMYYFVHPNAYYMRPLDPLILILGVYGILHRSQAVPPESIRPA